MRIETAWIFVGFGLLTIGTLLYIFRVSGDGPLATYLAVIGLVYVCIGAMLSLTHDRHMARRMRARRE